MKTFPLTAYFISSNNKFLWYNEEFVTLAHAAYIYVTVHSIIDWSDPLLTLSFPPLFSNNTFKPMYALEKCTFLNFLDLMWR